MFTLSGFSVKRPRYEITQGRSLEWLSDIHAAAQTALESLNASEREAFSTRFRKLLERCACGPAQIGTRGHVTPDLGASDLDSSALYDVARHPHGRGTATRSRVFAEVVDAYFDAEFGSDVSAPSELIHVTCTGYVAPSGAQRLVANKGWGARTHVTHAYHMGCYAAFPALRMAAGQLSVPSTFLPSGSEARVDIVHTELCTLHLDPTQHSAEQCVVQSLFGDGFVRYSVRSGAAQPGLEVLAISEQILPGTAQSMGWATGDFGMHMTLARDVPNHIAEALRPFVTELLAKAGLGLADLRDCVVAVHPGGPKIIDRVCETLELREAQVSASRAVLFDYGNMSSATLPHVWQRVLEDPTLPPGTTILSLAFGPGLTVCGGMFRKH